MSWDIEAFRMKVEQEHEFPGEYVFKFIVPGSQKEQITNLMPAGDISFRESSNKKYVSITARVLLNSSQDVLDVYMKAYKIDGCIAL